MTKKIKINDTLLFKQVAKVAGATEALKQLCIARSTVEINWHKGISHAFSWIDTPQGLDYWACVDFISILDRRAAIKKLKELNENE